MQTPIGSTASLILLVDDDRLVLSLLAASVARGGYRVCQAESAEEVEEMLTGGLRPDLAILDVRMPGQGGLRLAQRLRDFDHVPFMMLSAYSDPATVEEATRHGALGFLVKPLSDSQLLPSVEAALARGREMDALRTTRLQVQAALDNERCINVAVGILMMQHHDSRINAFERLRKAARTRRLRIADMAGEIVRLCEELHAAV